MDKLHLMMFYATRLKGGNIEFSTVGARAVVGDINLNARNLIKAENLQTENLSFNNNDIPKFKQFDIHLTQWNRSYTF